MPSQKTKLADAIKMHIDKKDIVIAQMCSSIGISQMNQLGNWRRYNKFPREAAIAIANFLELAGQGKKIQDINELTSLYDFSFVKSRKTQNGIRKPHNIISTRLLEIMRDSGMAPFTQADIEMLIVITTVGNLSIDNIRGVLTALRKQAC